jgi:hypothetical protein
MKKLAYFLIHVIFLFTGCSKDKPSGNSELILGTWKILPTTYELYTGGVPAGTSFEQYGTGDYAKFNRNLSYQFLANGRISNGSYRLEADSLVFDQANIAKIKSLTSGNMIYSFTTTISASQYRVTTYSFKR